VREDKTPSVLLIFIFCSGPANLLPWRPSQSPNADVKIQPAFHDGAAASRL
jgi:hypothetical protein